MKQGVYVASSTKKYPLGTRFAKRSDPLCRVWRYTKLAVTTRTGGYDTCGLGLFAKAISITSLTIVTAAKGARTVTISSPTLVVNAYAGGLFTMFESGQPICILGIISNTATVITLDGPLPGTYAAGANANAHVIPGPYNEVIIPGVSCSANAFDPCVGILNSPLDEDGNVAAAGDFVWVQTWGACNMWAQSYEGDNSPERDVVVVGDGTAQILTPGNLATYASYQRIGFLYPCTGPAADNVAEHPDQTGGVVTTLMNYIIFLQIAP